MDKLYHLCTQQAWVEALAKGEYRAASLDSEGFIHCSTRDQILGTANRFYRGLTGWVLLKIDPGQVQAEVRWEPADGNIFPHIYGPLNLEAVQGVSALLPAADGSFDSLPAGF